MTMIDQILESMSKLRFVYKGEQCYTAPDHLDESGWFKITEYDDFFLLMPYRMAPGLGEVPNNKNTPRMLKKSDGWEGIYCESESWR